MAGEDAPSSGQGKNIVDAVLLLGTKGECNKGGSKQVGIGMSGGAMHIAESN